MAKHDVERELCASCEYSRKNIQNQMEIISPFLTRLKETEELNQYYLISRNIRCFFFLI